MALAAATGAAFVREIFTGTYASDMGPWTPDAGKAMRYRDRLGAREVAMLYNVSAEFADSLDRRPLADRARSAVFSSIPDAVLVSGQITGEAARMDDLEAVKSALPDTPVLANTGVKHDTVAEVLRVADGCIVGSALKSDGDTWKPVDPDRATDFMARARAARGGTMMDRLRADLTDLMLIPGLSGHEDRVRRHLAAALGAEGIESRSDRLGNLIATFAGDPGAPSVMVFTHMDQLGFVVRKIEADGLIRVERLGGVPERALASQAVLLCVGEGRDVPGVIANKSHHATAPEEKYQVLKTAELVIDTGHGSKAAVEAAGIRIGTPVVYRPNVLPLAGDRIAGTSVDDRAGCAVLLEVARRLVRREAGPTVHRRLLGAGGVQPARRCRRGAGADARHRDPDRPDARHRHAGHGRPGRDDARRRPGHQPLFFPRPRHAERGDPAPAAVRLFEETAAASGIPLQRSRPGRGADRPLLCPARRRGRGLDRHRLPDARTPIRASRSAISATSRRSPTCSTPPSRGSARISH